MLRLRAANPVGALSQLSPSHRAQVLENVHPDLAGLMAYYRLEILLREIARRLKAIEIGACLELKEVMGLLPGKAKIDSLRKATWTRLYRMRNGFFHKDRESNDNQNADLIGQVLCLVRELPVFQSQ